MKRSCTWPRDAREAMANSRPTPASRSAGPEDDHEDDCDGHGRSEGDATTTRIWADAREVHPRVERVHGDARGRPEQRPVKDEHRATGCIDGQKPEPPACERGAQEQSVPQKAGGLRDEVCRGHGVILARRPTEVPTGG